ncbi:MAG: hypothetical protein B5M55_01535 [Desulfococcus sp. 4484_242]|nr:MAG: hypothetical protein B5M55_01535 [Desulfococcus sp. 4484_242]
MEGLTLIHVRPNMTIKRQQMRSARGMHQRQSPEAKPENRIVLDATNMFDAPGPGTIRQADVEALIPDIVKAHQMLKNDKGDIYDQGIPMTGWRDLPIKMTESHLSEIISLAGELGRKIDAYVSLGIGGSYLGIEATFKALTHTCFNQLTREERGGAPEIYFLGQNMDPDFLRDTLDMLRGKRIGINVISKSGTTTETAVAFRIMRRLMEANWGTEADQFILATTDKSHGALRKMAQKRGYRTFVVPDDIGGRFSVLSDVGLVGLAMANINIREFTAGFRNMREIVWENDFWRNPALVHAALRHAAWRAGKKIEVVATNAVSLYGAARWMEQLFPESEGHEGHGMWVSPSLYSEKLHANGQMVQEGERNIMETFLLLQSHDNQMPIPKAHDNLDGLDFLAEREMNMNGLNRMVIDGPAYAHHHGGVPNMTIEIPCRNAFNLGQFYYMMETSVAVSGYLLGHNPFNQPGVEAYKRAMFALIEKPGYEAATQDIKSRLKQKERIRI